MTDGMVTSDEFRDVLGRFTTGITVVSTRAPDGTDHAMTANALTSVSLEPPRILVCVEKIARFYDAVIGSGSWGVSILGERGEPAARWFATRGRPLDDQFAGFPYVRGEATGAPLLREAIATIECRTTDVYEGGDHVIVLGDVIGLAVTRPYDRPLLYYLGGYHSLGQATMEPLRRVT